MFKKIIVTLDGSPGTKKTLQAAFSLSNGNHSKLFFVHVAKEVHPKFATGELAQSVSDLNIAMREEGEEILNGASAEAEQNDIPCSAELLVGDPAEEILNFAKREKSDLIIMGSRGLGTFKEWMLGSVSHKVTQLAECPVLVIK